MSNQTTSVRGNSLPTGGVSATTAASQASSLLPNTETLKSISEMFMESSESNCIQLNKAALLPGQQISFTINNVGLGESLELYVTGEIDLANTAATPQVINVSPEFPFNLIGNMYSQFNGQTVLNSLSGYDLLGVMAKRGKNVFLGAKASSGNSLDVQNDTTVNKTMAWIKAGANVTFTTGTPALTGVKSLSVAATSTGIITFGFYLNLPYVLRNDILLGLIPMQNNSINLTVFITTPSILGTTAESPLYIPTTIPATISNSNNAITLQPTYNFWAIPQPNDATYYSYLISHSYMLISQANQSVQATGAEALQYNMPNNYFLMGLLLTLRDNTGALINVQEGLNNPYMSYNGTARVDKRDMNTRLARQSLYYEGIPSGLGQLLWDATDVSYITNGTNTTKWLDMYKANNPNFIADILSSVSAPVKFNVVREQLVPANIATV